ncbi:hypothetical protein L9F63_003999 [Diploptera punctata]|uniref:Ionotropic glutamate receptor C-terminal domain-containing protein n=1 Tax=Diploptera punctata TaxID=6984 RepID=A0AAD8E879_DIPPU|nr:hypothetical protein L9F63_003999 [Diploptera punctata]
MLHTDTFVRLLFLISVAGSEIGEEYDNKPDGHLALSVIKQILLENFRENGPVLISLTSEPNEVEEKFSRALKTQNLQTLNSIEDETLNFVYNYSLWPVSIFQFKNNDSFLEVPKVTNKCYIIFVNPEIQDFVNVVYDTIYLLQGMSSWNSRAKFVVVTYGKLPVDVSHAEVAHQVLSTLKSFHNITNALLLIVNVHAESNSIVTNGNNTDVTIMYAYTFSSYLNGKCDSDVPLLIRKWNLNNEFENIINGIDYFSNRLPKQFMGCTLNIGALGPEPYVMKRNTSKDGKDDFILTGVGLELVILFAVKMNFTVRFLEPITKIDLVPILDYYMIMKTGQMDIAAGCIPHVLVVPAYADVPIPIDIDTFKYIVPCPRPMTKTQKIMALFSLGTWTSILLSLIIVSSLFWLMSNIPIRKSNFTGFNLLAQCFSAAWSVLLGVSVPQMPFSLQTRCLFIIYVWYCFAISTVFQAFFTSFLVEPGYEIQLKNLDDVIRAGLVFGSYNIMELVKAIFQFYEMDQFNYMLYDDIEECVRNVMFERNTFTLFVTYFASYVASLSGVTDESKVVCFLDEQKLTFPLGPLLPLGSPLLHIFNTHIRHCLEGGLLQVYWSKIKHDVKLKADQMDEVGEYVVFNLTHLLPIFIVLLLGYILSAAVFLFEILIKLYVSKKIRNK